MQVQNSDGTAYSDIKSVALNCHSSHLKSDGTVCPWIEYGWSPGRRHHHRPNQSETGGNADGSPFTDVAKMTTGSHHPLFIKSDGSAWSVGRSSYGILADGNASNQSSPVRVIKSDDSNLSDVIEVSAGNFISMFLCADGTVWVSGTGYGNKAVSCSTRMAVPYRSNRYFRWERYIQFRKADGTVWRKAEMRMGFLGQAIQSP